MSNPGRAYEIGANDLGLGGGYRRKLTIIEIPNSKFQTIGYLTSKYIDIFRTNVRTERVETILVEFSEKQIC